MPEAVPEAPDSEAVSEASDSESEAEAEAAAVESASVPVAVALEPALLLESLFSSSELPEAAVSRGVPSTVFQ